MSTAERNSLATSIAAAGGLSLAALAAFRTFDRRRNVVFQITTAKTFFGSYTLKNVKLPVALLSKEQATIADAEGFVACTLKIASGKVTVVATKEATTTSPSSFYDLSTIDCQGAIFFPCFVDAHSHMVKTETVPRNRNTTGTITEAFNVCEPLDQPKWKNGDTDDAFARMDFAARCALHHGTRAIRTHLDGTAATDDPAIVAAVYVAYDRLQVKYADKLIIQGVANLYLPLWSNADFAQAFAKDAKSHKNTILGAYCGNPDPADSKLTQGHLESLFRIAHQVSPLLPLCTTQSTHHTKRYLARTCLSTR